MRKRIALLFWPLIIAMLSCETERSSNEHMFVSGPQTINNTQKWLSHEHILVDFIGADSIQPEQWNHRDVIDQIQPLLLDVTSQGIDIFVDATPNFLGRDVRLLRSISEKTGLEIMTNTGLYGARGNKYIPEYGFTESAEELAHRWIEEFDNGIDGTDIHPGFIKIGVDAKDSMDPIHMKLVEAAAYTHKKTGLTIASHTGPAISIWPQIELLEDLGVSPEALIWVHAQQEPDNDNYLKAAEKGCWISLDGLGWNWEEHIDKILFSWENDILDHILISHDAGWYDPQKQQQDIQPYTNLVNNVYPTLLDEGMPAEDIDQLITTNPLRAFSLKVRLQ